MASSHTVCLSPFQASGYAAEEEPRFRVGEEGERLEWGWHPRFLLLPLDGYCHGVHFLCGCQDPCDLLRAPCDRRWVPCVHQVPYGQVVYDLRRPYGPRVLHVWFHIQRFCHVCHRVHFLGFRIHIHRVYSSLCFLRCHLCCEPCGREPCNEPPEI